MHLLTQLLEMFLNTEHIAGDVVHYYVEACTIRLLFLLFLLLFQTVAFLLWLILLRFIDEVGMSHSDHVLVVHLLVDLKLSALVSLILLDLFNRHNFTSALKSAHEYFSKGADAALDLSCELILLREGIGAREAVVDKDTPVMVRLDVSVLFLFFLLLFLLFLFLQSFCLFLLLLSLILLFFHTRQIGSHLLRLGAAEDPQAKCVFICSVLLCGLWSENASVRRHERGTPIRLARIVVEICSSHNPVDRYGGTFGPSRF